MQKLNGDELASLAALRQLAALNLRGLDCASCTADGLCSLVAVLPRLRMLNAPNQLLVRTYSKLSDAVCTDLGNCLPRRLQQQQPRQT